MMMFMHTIANVFVHYIWSKNVDLLITRLNCTNIALHLLFCDLTLDEKQGDEIIVKNGSSTVAVTTILQDYHGPHLTGETMVKGNVHTKKMAASHNKPDDEVPKNKEVIAEDTNSQDRTSKPSSPSDCSDHPITNVISKPPVGRAGSSLLCNRVRVYPRTPDMLLPEGAISLPFSDDMWVAVSLDFSKHEG